MATSTVTGSRDNPSRGGQMLCLLMVLAAFVAGQDRLVSGAPFWRQRPWQARRLVPNFAYLYARGASVSLRRGGAQPESGESHISETHGEKTNGSFEERYSRQIFALGTRAQGLIRNSRIFIDGPNRSGLVYECAKNLALSGVREIVLVQSSLKTDEWYHNAALDDLGQAYHRAACREIGCEGVGDADVHILRQYLKHLNPALKVSVVARNDIPVLLESLLTHSDEGNVVSALVAVERPFQSQVSLNNACRLRNMPFVSTETAGVYSLVFCDFGDSFVVVDDDGESPQVVLIDKVELCNESVNHQTESVVISFSCLPGERHDLSEGDLLDLLGPDGKQIELSGKVVRVETPHLFKVGLECAFDECKAISACRKVKLPQLLTFRRIDEVVKAGKVDPSCVTPSDLDKSFDARRRETIFACFHAQTQCATHANSHDHTAKLDPEMFIHQVGLVIGPGEARKEIVDSFLRSGQAKFTPLQAIVGAIASQEALKAITGLYNPIQQFLAFDCDEIAQNCFVDASCDKATACLARGLLHVVGQEAFRNLQAMRVFVVGAGAIGCELLKNLAAMMIGSLHSGCVVVTDMDSIEVSNLSRQLLFREADVGSFKSVAAESAALGFGNIHIESHSHKVGDDEHGPFNDKFWEKHVDVVLSALDNVDARIYMDQKCVEHGRPLVDTGTQGAKGSCQVIVPFKTESYSSTVDPPDQEIPACTLKTFPYMIEHTIQWGRDLFEGSFAVRPARFNAARESLGNGETSATIVTKLLTAHGDEEAKRLVTELIEDMKFSGDIETATNWAATLALELFVTSPQRLLKSHPPESLDEDGELFWSGARKMPQPLQYTKDSHTEKDLLINRNLEAFVAHAARLRCEAFKHHDCEAIIPSPASAERALRQAMTNAQINDDDSKLTLDFINALESSILDLSKRSGIGIDTRKAFEIEFEKDNDSNGHVEFITAASNLRAISYGIPTTTHAETRRIAGKIVPAMVTTTALVSGLSCLELIKLAQNAPVRCHRNGFVNLAIPFFAFTPPVPATKHVGLQGRDFTMWDKIVVKESKKAAAKGGLKLKSLLKHIAKQASDHPDDIVVTSIFYGPYLLYARFLHEDDMSTLKTSVWKIIADTMADVQDARDAGYAAGMESSRTTIELTVVVEDQESGQEVQLPLVRVVRSSDDTING